MSLKKTLFLLVLFVSFIPDASSYTRVKHRQFYYGVDLNYGNLYSFAVSSCLTGLANYYIGKPLFINGFEYEIPRFNSNSMAFSKNNAVGINARDLINNVNPGVRLGYMSEYKGTFNWGVYATCHYNYRQYLFDTIDSENGYQTKEQHILPGICFRLLIGGIDSNVAVAIDAGLKYSIPFKYDCLYGNELAQVNDGFVSHFALSLCGHRFLQNLSLFVDICHFNVLNHDYVYDNAKPYEFVDYRPISIGLSWTITRKQAENREYY